MSRGFAFAGVCLAGMCGVLVAYSTFRPELEKQKAERQGEILRQQGTNDKAISQAIISDFREAGQQIRPSETKGFAWGIREAIWGSPKSEQTVTAPKMPIRNDTEMKESPRQVLEKGKDASTRGG